ncbi:MAG: hypothetical protein K0S74_1762 [Chlamydiales bacterium]|nr:hypothetical protein [Chlamydiales bacterium]
MIYRAENSVHSFSTTQHSSSKLAAEKAFNFYSSNCLKNLDDLVALMEKVVSLQIVILQTDSSKEQLDNFRKKLQEYQFSRYVRDLELDRELAKKFCDNPKHQQQASFTCIAAQVKAWLNTRTIDTQSEYYLVVSPKDEELESSFSEDEYVKTDPMTLLSAENVEQIYNKVSALKSKASAGNIVSPLQQTLETAENQTSTSRSGLSNLSDRFRQIRLETADSTTRKVQHVASNVFHFPAPPG